MEYNAKDYNAMEYNAMEYNVHKFGIWLYFKHLIIAMGKKTTGHMCSLIRFLVLV